jgi:hypothetical protein
VDRDRQRLRGRGVWLSATVHGLFRLPLLPPYEEGAAPAPWRRQRVWAGAGAPVAATRAGDQLVFAGPPSLATFWNVGALWDAGNATVTPVCASVPTTAETLARPPLSSRLRGTGAPAERCHAPAADGPGAPPATPAPGRGNSGQPCQPTRSR